MDACQRETLQKCRTWDDASGDVDLHLQRTSAETI